METGRGLAMPPFPKRGVDDGEKTELRYCGDRELAAKPFASHTSF